MEELMELLAQIQELAGVGIDAIAEATGGGGSPEGGTPVAPGGPPPEGAPPEGPAE